MTLEKPGISANEEVSNQTIKQNNDLIYQGTEQYCHSIIPPEKGGEREKFTSKIAKLKYCELYF